MRENVQNKDSLCRVVDSRNQAILVSFDVKHGSPPNNIGVTEITPSVCQISPLRTVYDPVPVHQRNISVGMLLGEVQDRPLLITRTAIVYKM